MARVIKKQKKSPSPTLFKTNKGGWGVCASRVKHGITPAYLRLGVCSTFLKNVPVVEFYSIHFQCQLVFHWFHHSHHLPKQENNIFIHFHMYYILLYLGNF